MLRDGRGRGRVTDDMCCRDGRVTERMCCGDGRGRGHGRVTCTHVCCRDGRVTERMCCRDGRGRVTCTHVFA